MQGSIRYIAPGAGPATGQHCPAGETFKAANTSTLHTLAKRVLMPQDKNLLGTKSSRSRSAVNRPTRQNICTLRSGTLALPAPSRQLACTAQPAKHPTLLTKKPYTQSLTHPSLPPPFFPILCVDQIQSPPRDNSLCRGNPGRGTSEAKIRRQKIANRRRAGTLCVDKIQSPPRDNSLCRGNPGRGNSVTKNSDGCKFRGV